MKPDKTTENQNYDDPSYKIPAGVSFIKNGNVGKKYVVVDCDKVVSLVSVGVGSVMVMCPPMNKHETISRHTEVIPYKEAEHKHLIKQVLLKKESE